MDVITTMFYIEFKYVHDFFLFLTKRMLGASPDPNGRSADPFAVASF